MSGVAPTEAVKEKKKGLFERIWDFLQPGIDEKLITFARYCILAAIIALALIAIFNYNIHYVIMTVLAICLELSYEYLIAQIRKNPELMNKGKKAE